MKVLVACEESQRVCTAFRKRGHEAYSCDIVECSGGHPEWHILGDCLLLLDGNQQFRTMDEKWHWVNQWDLLIAHPPCTYLTNCANRAFSLNCTAPEKVIERWKKRTAAAIFFMRFTCANSKKIVIENPVGIMNTAYRKADQIIHPYYFAKTKNDFENYHQKRTCLWLFNLEPLKRTTNLPKPAPKYISKGEKTKRKRIGWCEGMSGVKGGQQERAKMRSKTFPGIAEAMAEQWG